MKSILKEINKKYHIAQAYDEPYEEFKQRLKKLIKENNITDLSEISINCGMGIPVQFKKGE